jgi:ribonuclease HI
MAKLTQNQTGGASTTAGVPRVPRWQKLNAGVVKINWDATISTPEETIGVGVVARDNNGSVVGAFCCMRSFILDPTTAEAVGAWQAVMFGKRLGVERVIFEGDSLEVVNAVKNGNSCWARYGMMVNTCLEELRTIPTWDFRHVQHEGNRAAHRLAKQSFVFRDTRVWLGILPSCIQDVLTVDNSSSV